MKSIRSSSHLSHRQIEPEAPKKSEEACYFKPLAPHVQSLLNAAREVAEFIELKRYYSDTESGVSDVFEWYENAILTEALRSSLDRVRADAFLAEGKEFSKPELYFLSKSAGKVQLGSPESENKKTVWVGNCGEKAYAAVFNLIKYFPEEIKGIKSIELMTILSNKNRVFTHCVVVLNRNHLTEAHLDPSRWIAAEPDLEVIILDPSFNRAFLAKDYKENLVMHHSKTFPSETEIRNQYVAYIPGAKYQLKFDPEILSQNLPLINEYMQQKNLLEAERLKTLAKQMKKEIVSE